MSLSFTNTLVLKDEVIVAQAVAMAEIKYKWGINRIKSVFDEIEKRKISLRKKMYIERVLREGRKSIEELEFRLSMQYSSMGLVMMNRIRESNDLYFGLIMGRSNHEMMMCNEFVKVEKIFDKKIKEYEVNYKFFCQYRRQLIEYVDIIRRTCQLELILGFGVNGVINPRRYTIC